MYQRRLCMFALGLALVLATGASAQVQGKVLIEYWFGNGVDNNLDNLKANADFPDNPAYGEYLDAMDRPDFVDMDNWGARLRAWLTPPQTGDYTFWTASDDDSEVWLSTDDSPANATLICNVEGWGGYQDWTGTSSMGANFKSKPVTLEAGKRYYIETLMADGGGGGFVSVAWAGPGIGDAPTVIGSAYLSAPASESPFVARFPNPASGSVDVTAPLFQWTAGPNAKTDDIYFGTNPNPGPAEFQGKFKSAPPLFFYTNPAGLTPGATYYWRVDTTDTAGVLHTGKVWNFTVMPVKATEPNPVDGASWRVFSGQTLSWKIGQNEPTHDLYFGADKAAVEAGDAGVFKGNLTDASFETGALEPSTTYYWRVDEIDAMGTKFVGDVWSFTTTLPGLGTARREIWWNMGGGTAVSDLTSNKRYAGPADLIDEVPEFRTPIDIGDNYGGRLSAMLHVPTAGEYTFWVASDDSSQLFFGATPGKAKVIASVSGWAGDNAWDSNASQKSETMTLEAGVYFIQALWKEGGGGDNCSAGWQGPGIPRQVIGGGYLEPFTPLWSSSPSPADSATNVKQTPVLSWVPGVKAAKQAIYFGTDAAAVAAADATSPLFKGEVGTDVLTFDPGTLDWNTTYYWRVDEVNEAEATSPWVGGVWSFKVADFLVIDLAQTSLGYDNTASPFFSELAFDVPADWTTHGEAALALRFQGAAPAAASTAGSTSVDAAGVYTVVGAGSDIWNASDQFRFAYMPLNGDGEIQAKVESVDNTNGSGGWSKGGVMIRPSVAANAVYAIEAVSGGGAANGGGVGFQWRPSAGASATAGPDGPGIAAPYWVKLTRVGDVITGFNSADGVTWTQQGDPQTIAMPAKVLIGLAVSSHVDLNTLCKAVFSNVSVKGDVDQASATSYDVKPGNSTQPIYVAVQDAAGKVAVATYPEPAATTITSWTSWKIPLSDLAGVDLKNVAKLFVGVGDSLNPTPDGTGVILIDSVRVVKPVSLPPVITSVVRANGQSGTRTEKPAPPITKFDGNTTPAPMSVGGLKDGSIVFSDRNYPWSKIPAELIGAEYIPMFNSDKSKGETDVTYTVTLSRAAMVWVTADDRIPAEWAAIGSQQAAVDQVVAAFAAPGTFVDTGLNVCIHENATTDRPMSVYAANLPAGTYVFGIQNSDKNFYTIGAIGGAGDVTLPGDNVLGLPANSNWPAAESPANVIDNNTGTKFLHFSGKTEPTGFQVQPFVGATVVTGLTFTSANDSPERDPVKFELSGSNDSLKGPWTLIAAGDIADFAGATAWPRTTIGSTPITFENATAYKFYQVMFPVVRDPTKANSMQISEVELLGVLAQ